MRAISLVGTAFLLVSLAASCRCQTLKDVYTSTRSVTGIIVTPDHRIIAGTRGGVLMCKGGGTWQKHTILDGLPGNEVLGVYQQEDRIVARTTKGYARLQDGRWVGGTDTCPEFGKPLIKGQICSARWKGVDCVATTEGLRIRSGGSWRPIPLPHSTGTHISALLDRGKTLWAAMFADGVFAWDGKSWTVAKLAFPKSVREITSMASDGDRLVFGTSQNGLWEHDGHRWVQHLQPNEPRNHNCQALAWFQDNLYVGTIDSGLMVYTPKGWQHITTPSMSSDTPRQIVEFERSLYLRQSTGVVDRFDGKVWTKNVLPDLPRKQCSALAVHGGRLYAGQWGGWSESENGVWAHHLDVAELQGRQMTVLLPEDDHLWIGTQGLGLAEIARAGRTMKWHNELVGMPDDTIKCLARQGDSVCAGTFSQGLAWMTQKTGDWVSAPEIAGAQVTSLATDGTGGLYVGARTGLWRLTTKKRMVPIMKGIEVQALQLAGSDLWVGTRDGLLRFADDPDQP